MTGKIIEYILAAVAIFVIWYAYKKKEISRKTVISGLIFGLILALAQLIYKVSMF